MTMTFHVVVCMASIMAGPHSSKLVTLDEVRAMAIPIDITVVKGNRGRTVTLAYDDDEATVLPTLSEPFRKVSYEVEVLDKPNGRTVATIPMDTTTHETEFTSQLDGDADFVERCVVSIHVSGAGRSHRFVIPLDQFISGKSRAKEEAIQRMGINLKDPQK